MVAQVSSFPVTATVCGFGWYELGHHASVSKLQHVARVPAGLRTKAELMDALAFQARLPRYFGNNWDALEECLADLHWLNAECLVISHTDIPLVADASMCHVYLDLLTATVRSTRTGRGAASTRLMSNSQPKCAIWLKPV
mgnify:FL=1